MVYIGTRFPPKREEYKIPNKRHPIPSQRRYAIKDGEEHADSRFYHQMTSENGLGGTYPGKSGRWSSLKGRSSIHKFKNRSSMA